MLTIVQSRLNFYYNTLQQRFSTKKFSITGSKEKLKLLQKIFFTFSDLMNFGPFSTLYHFLQIVIDKKQFPFLS